MVESAPASTRRMDSEKFRWRSRDASTVPAIPAPTMIKSYVFAAEVGSARKDMIERLTLSNKGMTRKGEIHRRGTFVL